ncbi:MAG TPA: hypothetical protein VNS58_16135 [Puia sp.]|nr:hypothetical protein [Puia sp.]
MQVFSYDKQHQLAALHSYSYDTSTGSPFIDSFSVVFALTGSTTPPPSYDILYQYHWALPGGLLEHHELYYDNQNRVVRDSIAAGNNGTNLTSVHFYYDSINTVGQNLGYDTTLGNQVTVGETDTFQIQSDNIVYDLRYTQPGYFFLHLYSYLYTTNVNPLYNQTFANSLGCVLVFHGFADFRSKNLPSEAVKTDGVLPGVGLNYSWTTDSIGRVIQGIAVYGSPQQIYSFKY